MKKEIQDRSSVPEKMKREKAAAQMHPRLAELRSSQVEDYFILLLVFFFFFAGHMAILRLMY
jgi:hypothetical protein